MSKSNAFENALLLLIFNATAIADIAEDDTSSPATDLYVSLHTSDPGEGGNQTSNETSYGSYARVAVARDGSGWTVTGNSVSPVDPIVFPAPASGSGTITHFGVGKSSSGTGLLMYSGTITPNIAITVGVPPTLATSSTITED